MKFIVSSSTLLKHLSKINGVITTNPVVPILENFLFEIEDGLLSITASDLQTSMITQFEVDAKENGKVAVPAKILMDTLKNLPDQPVTISINEESYTIEISSDNGKYKLAGENATDFPKAPEVNDGYAVDFNSGVLASAINNTIFATSSDELRPAMTGVFMNFNETQGTMVATDGHRLVRFRRGDVTMDMDHSIIVPRRALNLLKSVLPSKSSAVRMEFNMSHAFYSFENIQMTCRLIDERFPDYENVIPKENDKHLTINRMELLSSLKRIAIYANKTTHQVRLKISGMSLQISAEDLDFSNEANERLTCDYVGDDIEIGFNARFLMEILNNLSCTEVKLELSAPNRAGLIIPNEQNDDEDILMLVMPVMLNQHA